VSELYVCCQSENVDNSMDQSNTSALSHDPEDDKSLVLQYEGNTDTSIDVICCPSLYHH